MPAEDFNSDVVDFGGSDFGSSDFGGVVDFSAEGDFTPDTTPPIAAAQPTEDKTFLGSMQKSFGEDVGLVDQVIEHPIDSIVAAGEGIAAGVRGIVNDPGQAADAVGDFVGEAIDNPAATAGSLVGSLPLALATGGAGGFAVKQGLKYGLKASLATQGAGVVGASVVGGAAAGAAGAGIRAESQGRDVTEREAVTAAVMTGAFGALSGSVIAPKGSLIGKDSAIAKGAAKLKIDEKIAAFSEKRASNIAVFLDPMTHFESKAAKESGEGLGAPKAATNVTDTYEGVTNDIADLSGAQKKARENVATEIAPLEEATARVKDSIEAPILLEALREADATKGSTKIKDSDLRERGLSDDSIALFRAILHRAKQNYVRAGKAASKQGAEDAGEVPYGRIPHIFEGEHRVYTDFEGLKGVQGFDDLAAARAYVGETGGLLLNSNRFAGFSTDDIINVIDRKKLKTAAEVFDALDVAKGKRIANVEGMLKERKGVEGYVTFRSLPDVIEAVRRGATISHSAELATPLIHKLNNTAELLSKNGDEVSAEILHSMLDRIVGKRKTDTIASGLRGMAFHVVLGVANHVAPILNVGSAILFTPAFILREARRAGAEPTLLKAIWYTVSSMPSLVPQSLRKAMPRLTNQELVSINESMGHIPSAESVNFGDKSANKRLQPYEVSSLKLKPALTRKVNKIVDTMSKINTWQMRHTESSARRMVSVAFRKMAEDSAELTSTQKERLITRGVNKTAGDFDKGMRAQVLEGGSTATDLASVMLTFQTYIWKKAIESWDMFKHDKQAFFTMMAPLMAVSGVVGVPLAMSALDGVVDTLDEDGSLKRDWNKFKADNVGLFHGVLSKLPADASGRFALTLPAGVGSEYGFNLRGVMDMFANAAGKALDGDIKGAVRGVIPNDALRAAGGVSALLGGEDAQGKLSYDPVSRGSYGKHDKINKAEAIGAALFGLPPSSSAEKDRKNRNNNDLVLRQRERVQDVRATVERMIRNGDFNAKKRTELFRKLKAIKPSAKYKQFKGWEERARAKGAGRFHVKSTKAEQRLINR